MNEELLAKARAAKSPEELLSIAHDYGITGFTIEAAKKYFDAFQSRHGELADEELNVSAGGCGALRAHGRKMVSVFNRCNHYRCGACNGKTSFKPLPVYLDEEELHACDKDFYDPFEQSGHTVACGDCYYCSYERGAWWCNNKPHYNE